MGDDKEGVAFAGVDPAALALEEAKYTMPLGMSIKACVTPAPDSEGDDFSSEADTDDSGSRAEEVSDASDDYYAVALEAGYVAEISGLESAAGNKYNGTVCTLRSWDEDAE